MLRRAFPDAFPASRPEAAATRSPVRRPSIAQGTVSRFSRPVAIGPLGAVDILWISGRGHWRRGDAEIF
jgi:hypothetical protein